MDCDQVAGGNATQSVGRNVDGLVVLVLQILVFDPSRDGTILCACIGDCTGDRRIEGAMVCRYGRRAARCVRVRDRFWDAAVPQGCVHTVLVGFLWKPGSLQWGLSDLPWFLFRLQRWFRWPYVQGEGAGCVECCRGGSGRRHHTCRAV